MVDRIYLVHTASTHHTCNHLRYFQGLSTYTNDIYDGDNDDDDKLSASSS